MAGCAVHFFPDNNRMTQISGCIERVCGSHQNNNRDLKCHGIVPWSGIIGDQKITSINQGFKMCQINIVQGRINDLRTAFFDNGFSDLFFPWPGKQYDFTPNFFLNDFSQFCKIFRWPAFG